MWRTFYPVPCPPDGQHGIDHCVKRGPEIAAGTAWQAAAALRDWDIELPSRDDTCIVDGTAPWGPAIFVQSIASDAWYAVLQEV